MDRAKRIERIADRILGRLAHAGPDGLRRSKVISDACNHDYRFGSEVLNICLNDGRVETVDGRVRLTLAGVDELAANGWSHWVDPWLNVDYEPGREFRRLRLEMTGGSDVTLHAGSCGERPRYRCAWGELNDEAYRRAWPESGWSASEPGWFWVAPEPIPAGKPGRVQVPSHVPGQIAEIEVPAQPFAWTPHVVTTGPHNLAVMVEPEPVTGGAPQDFWA